MRKQEAIGEVISRHLRELKLVKQLGIALRDCFKFIKEVAADKLVLCCFQVSIGHVITTARGMLLRSSLKSGESELLMLYNRSTGKCVPNFHIRKKFTFASMA